MINHSSYEQYVCKLPTPKLLEILDTYGIMKTKIDIIIKDFMAKK